MKKINSKQIKQLPTPFYYYDLDLLEETLITVQNQSNRYGFHVHYALKANNNPEILKRIQKHGIGADCVSGNEIKAAIEYGFSPEKIFFAGVGKTDEEIKLAIERNIYCFNVESLQELEVLGEWAKILDKKINIALRLNPNIDAKTHSYISTGRAENKFGIADYKIEKALEILQQSPHLNLLGLHFHIGSQITDLKVYKSLCEVANKWNHYFLEKGIRLPILNLGGGLGIDYQNPDKNRIPDFEAFFAVFAENLKLEPNQQVHFELGRSLVGQSGSLVSKVLYIKETQHKNFAIIDAGMTDLLRPALYQVEHKIELLEPKTEKPRNYEIVGPICESSDSFANHVELPELKRGDYLIIRSTGAYGEVMTSEYNMRDKIRHYFLN